MDAQYALVVSELISHKPACSQANLIGAPMLPRVHPTYKDATAVVGMAIGGVKIARDQICGRHFEYRIAGSEERRILLSKVR